MHWFLLFIKFNFTNNIEVQLAKIKLKSSQIQVKIENKFSKHNIQIEFDFHINCSKVQNNI